MQLPKPPWDLFQVQLSTITASNVPVPTEAKVSTGTANTNGKQGWVIGPDPKIENQARTSLPLDAQPKTDVEPSPKTLPLPSDPRPYQPRSPHIRHR